MALWRPTARDEKAMQMAYADGVAHSAIDDAKLVDAFACHFLTDAFSASHAKTPRASIKEYWDGKVPGFHSKLIQWLADRIEQEFGALKRAAAIGIPFIPVVGPIVSTAAHMPNSTVRTATVQKLSLAFSPTDSLSFGNVMSLIVHDVQGAATVEAEIGGNPITLVGDKELITDKKDPVTQQHSHTVSSEARPTFDAATAAVKASIEDLYTAHMAGWKSDKFSDAYQKVMGRKDRLYPAERLIPQPLDDSRVPAEKRSLGWMHKSLNDFLADPRTPKALETWGRVEAPEFQKKLDALQKQGDLPPEANHALQQALIIPLQSGDGKKIAAILKQVAGR